MSPEKQFLEFCIAKAYKNTEQQRTLVREIFKLNQCFTVDSLLGALEGKGISVSRATVIRTLNLLEKAEMVQKNALFSLDDTYTPIYFNQ